MRYILIYCEGDTECEYFNILKEIFRVPYIQIESIDCRQQHESLMDSAKDSAGLFCEDNDIDMSAVEIWAVCDRDDYRYQYSKLENYANNKGVHLAFSDPQFENFLLQHFSQSNNVDHGSAVELAVTSMMNAEGINERYVKSDLTWLASISQVRLKLQLLTPAFGTDRHLNRFLLCKI